MAIAYCMFVYLCWLGFLPTVTKLSSIRAVGVLAKLSFPTFMIHYPILWYNFATLTQPIEFTSYNLAIASISLYSISVVLGVLIHLFVEAPAANLMRLVMTRGNVVARPIRSK